MKLVRVNFGVTDATVDVIDATEDEDLKEAASHINRLFKENVTLNRSGFSAAQCFFVRDCVCYAIVIYRGEPGSPEWVASLAHEAVHVAQMWCRDTGVKGFEALAYATDLIVRKAMKGLLSDNGKGQRSKRKSK